MKNVFDITSIPKRLAKNQVFQSHSYGQMLSMSPLHTSEDFL